MTPAFSAPSHCLRAEGLEALRGEVMLFEGLELTLNSGQVLQVDGPNGAGKTTLLRTLAGLTLPEAGEVYWDGEPIRRNRAAYAEALNYVGHQHGIKAGLTVLENLQVYQKLTGGNGDPVEALVRMGLERQLHNPGYTLSAGQRRRAALARLLLRPAPLWIIDEPYTALDVHGIALVDQLVREQVLAGGMVVLTSHQRVELSDLPLLRLRLGS